MASKVESKELPSDGVRSLVSSSSIASSRTGLRKMTKADLLELKNGMPPCHTHSGRKKDRAKKELLPNWEVDTPLLLQHAQGARGIEEPNQTVVFSKAVAKLRYGHRLIGQAHNELESFTPSAAELFLPADFMSAERRVLDKDDGNSSSDRVDKATSPTRPTSPTRACSTAHSPLGDQGNENEALRPEASPEAEKQQHVDDAIEESVPRSELGFPSKEASTDIGYQSESTVRRRSWQEKILKAPSFGKFTQGASSESIDSETLTTRDCVGAVVNHPLTQSVSVCFILLTIVLICIDTNARARGSESSALVDLAMTTCFVAYVLEFLADLYSRQSDALRDSWFYTDSLVIFASLLGYICSAVHGMEGMELLRLFRLFRLLRLGRLVRALRLMQNVSWLKEPYILCLMMASCLRTLIWAFLLMFFIITFWSILAVELLNEVVLEIASSSSIWDDCERCPSSFSSIWDSNLTFFQTIVAGDSWGKVALPVIQERWWSVIIFFGALSTVIFGVLNMIAAVVIDTFAERRAKDVSSMANELEYEELFERKRLEKMFVKIDEDQSGALTKEELRDGARKIQEFRQYLRVLDIDDKDLSELFDIIDADGSGEIDPAEFIDALYRMKTTESRTATRFVKHMVGNLFEKQVSMTGQLDTLRDQVTNRLDEVKSHFAKEFEENQNPEKIKALLTAHTEEIEKTLSLAIDKAVSAAFDAVVGTAATQASSSIQQVVLTSSNMAIAKAERGRLSDFSSVSSASRQVSGSSYTSVDSLPVCTSRKSQHPSLPHYLHVRTSDANSKGVVQLGEVLPTVPEINTDGSIRSDMFGA